MTDTVIMVAESARSLLALATLTVVSIFSPAAAKFYTIPGELQQNQSPGNHGNAGKDPSQFKCELDPKLTAEDLPFFIPDIKGNWGDACGRNRGVFVLDPPDGHTYDCGKLPEEWGVANVADLADLHKTDAETALKAYSNFVQAVYNTTIDKTVSACNFDGLTILTCGREEPWKTAPWFDQIKAPIRAVNIGGLFVLERWILPTFTKWGKEHGIVDQHSFSEKCKDLGTCDELKVHWNTWYSAQDFLDMKKAGLNSVRLPVGWWYFAEKTATSYEPYIVPDADLYDEDHPITRVISWAKGAGLYVILDLHGAPGSQNGLDNSGLQSPDPNELVWGETWMYSPVNYGNTVRILAAMAEYINHIEDKFSLDNVMALELLNEPWAHLDLGRVRDFYVTGIEAVRLVRPLMPIILHDSFRGPMWATLLKDFPYKNVIMDTHIYHGFNRADAASDDAVADRQKMYVHERMACSYTSMLRYETCAMLPVMVGEWSLAIDNCMPWLDSKFADYGQCNNFDQREKSSWWTEHTRSFAGRQLAMYEREMGWAFWTWKLEDHAEKHEPAAKYWSFHLAVEHGFIDTKYPTDACLHPPATDWAKGDLNESSTDLAATGGGEREEVGLDASDASGSGAGTPKLEEGVQTSQTRGEASRTSTFSTMALMGAAAIGTILGSLMTIAIGRAKAERVGGGGGGSIDVGGVEREKETGRVGGSWLLGAFGGGYETIRDGCSHHQPLA